MEVETEGMTGVIYEGEQALSPCMWRSMTDAEAWLMFELFCAIDAFDEDKIGFNGSNAVGQIVNQNGEKLDGVFGILFTGQYSICFRANDGRFYDLGTYGCGIDRQCEPMSLDIRKPSVTDAFHRMD